MLRLDHDNTLPFLDASVLDARITGAEGAHRTLLKKAGPGSDATGWRDLLVEPDDALLGRVSETAQEISEEADVLVCIGIGGSYLGARAVIQALTPYFRHPSDVPEIVFAGHHLSGTYLHELLQYLEGRSVYVNVISKSGTTLEPALAFRSIRRHLENTYDDPERRIIVTTDPSAGALNTLSAERGYRKFEIPRDVGGRFSVLTPVGLLPIASAGIDTSSLFYGAVDACNALASAEGNPALLYAAVRSALLDGGLSVDLLSVFEPRLHGFGLWWQQLFGESEGKDGTGLFPSVAQYTTDLHSIGQYVQDGQRTLAETFLMVEDDGGDLEIPSSDDDLDGLNYVAGKTMSFVNRAAHNGTSRAHADGGVPNMTLWLENVSPKSIGEAIYFFEHAVSVSGYLLGVNPFDQPGVEAYKKEMFSRLGRP